ncbi:MAG TPA: hypothetical protein VLJ59_12305 [Mycobacteriales bacterium]|nr:hypothetical protein [Mycobacteriales bacterium]
MLAAAGLFTSDQQTSRRARAAIWSSFLLGIAVSLAANIAAALTEVSPTVQPPAEPTGQEIM